MKGFRDPLHVPILCLIGVRPVPRWISLLGNLLCEVNHHVELKDAVASVLLPCPQEREASRLQRERKAHSRPATLTKPRPTRTETEPNPARKWHTEDRAESSINVAYGGPSRIQQERGIRRTEPNPARTRHTRDRAESSNNEAYEGRATSKIEVAMGHSASSELVSGRCAHRTRSCCARLLGPRNCTRWPGACRPASAPLCADLETQRFRDRAEEEVARGAAIRRLSP